MNGRRNTKKLKVDKLLGGAVEFARDALEPIAPREQIGEYLGAYAEDERLVTHSFDCLKAGYLGWKWVVTLTRVPRSKHITVCEIDLLPGDNALLAPAWVPWAERLEPGDNKREDVLPYVPNDPLLDESFEDTNEEELDKREIEEIGLGRPRVLSAKGRAEAAKRWYDSEQGPARAHGRRLRSPVHTCSDCGFMLKISGSMRRMFGVCANRWSPDDGRVVSLDHSCGAHSETDLKLDNSQWEAPPHRLDESDLEIVNLNR